MCSTRVLVLAALAFVLRFVVASPMARAAGEGWPEGYVIAEESQSPDGRYGVLIPGNEVGGDANDPDTLENKLVDLKTHRRLAIIHNAHYFERANHYGLIVKWAPDSSWCVVTYDARYGFAAITLVQIEGTKCIQSDLGKEIQGSMDLVITRVSKKVQSTGYGQAFFRQGPGHTILVRGTAYTNPKAFEDQPTNHARFEGTFDLATRKWTRSSAANLEDWDALSGTLADLGAPMEGTDEEKLKAYDDSLNQVYNAVRTVLPAKRFAEVKKEQREWLKQLEAQTSAAAKIKLMGARTEKLRDLLWQP